MAIDLNTSRNGYERTKWYKGYYDNRKLLRSETLEGVIYARDTLKSYENSIATGETKNIQYILQLETTDSVTIVVDDFIEWDGEFYVVTKTDQMDMLETREFSRRRSYKTTIDLRK